MTKTITTPIGELTIHSDGTAITRISFGDSGSNNTSPLLEECEKQLNEYFDGTRKDFDLPLSPNGTDFQKQVWAACTAIPYGETRTYGELATQLGQPNAARAVGAALGANPTWVVMPCHRVLGASGKLTGFAGGLDVKQWLLEHEANAI